MRLCLNSKSFLKNLLLIFVLSITACKNEITKKLDLSDEDPISDSIQNNYNVFINIPAKNSIILNVPDTYTHLNPIPITNDSKIDSVISISSKSLSGNTIIKQNKIVIKKNGSIDRISQSFYLPKINKDLKLNFNQKKQQLDGVHDLSIVDSMYRNIHTKINDRQDLNPLDEILKIHDNLAKNYNDSILVDYNDLTYHLELEKFTPGNPLVDKYLKKQKRPIKSQNLNRLLVLYVGNRASNISFSQSKSDFNELMAIGVFEFLRQQQGKGSSRYPKLKNWLRTTATYKKDSTFIKSKIEPFDSDKFRKKILNIELDRDWAFQSISSEFKKSYFLIDFWATWCAPCIEGVKTMKEMDMPDNVQVISISLDKEKDHEKWKQMTKELGQEVSFRMSDTIQVNQDFLEFIEVKSIPRYILMDKNFNLIDQAFYHPQEPQFLLKLNDVKNHKRW